MLKFDSMKVFLQNNQLQKKYEFLATVVDIISLMRGIPENLAAISSEWKLEYKQVMRIINLYLISICYIIWKENLTLL